MITGQAQAGRTRSNRRDLPPVPVRVRPSGRLVTESRCDDSDFTAKGPYKGLLRGDKLLHKFRRQNNPRLGPEVKENISASAVTSRPPRRPGGTGTLLRGRRLLSVEAVVFFPMVGFF